jgi:UPF0716 protein FxsA
MFLLLTMLFLVLPIVELWVIVAAAHTFGIPETLIVLVLVSVVGAYVCKWAGISVLARMQKTVRRGGVPTREVTDGFLVLLAGALLLVPGFVSDIVALALLFPPTRAIARRLIIRRYQGRLETYGLHDGAKVTETYGAYRDRRAGVVDVSEVWDEGGSTGSTASDPLLELGP